MSFDILHVIVNLLILLQFSLLAEKWLPKKLGCPPTLNLSESPEGGWVGGVTKGSFSVKFI